MAEGDVGGGGSEGADNVCELAYAVARKIKVPRVLVPGEQYAEWTEERCGDVLLVDYSEVLFPERHRERRVDEC